MIYLCGVLNRKILKSLASPVLDLSSILLKYSAMSELLNYDHGSESISDIMLESNLTDLELQAEDVGR